MDPQTSETHGNERLPLDIQFLILEQTSMKDQDRLSLVCKTWQTFIQTSPVLVQRRYRPSKMIEEDPYFGGRRVPRLHKLFDFYNALVLDDKGYWKPCHFRRTQNTLRSRSGLLPLDESQWHVRPAITHGGEFIRGEIFRTEPLLGCKSDPFAVWTPGDRGKLDVQPGFIELGNKFSREKYQIRFGPNLNIHSEMTVREVFQEIIRLVNKEKSWLYTSSKDVRGVEHGECDLIEIYKELKVPYVVPGKPFDIGKAILDLRLIPIPALSHMTIEGRREQIFI